MSDTMITSGAEAPSETPGAAVTTQEPTQSTGSGSAASESGRESTTTDGGSSQGTAEGTQGEQSQRRKWSYADEVKELRAWRRDARQRESTYQSTLSDLNRQIEELRQSRQGNAKPVRDPSKFWQDPEAAIEEKLSAIRDELLDRVVGEFHSVREVDEQTQALKQEQSAGVEFIRSQKGYSSEDDEELVDIIEENGFKALSPMAAAQAAWAVLQQRRGVADKSTLRARASTVVGQAPGAGFGKKVWSKAEYDRVLDDISNTPQHMLAKKLTPELEAELIAAAREGRVR